MTDRKALREIMDEALAALERGDMEGFFANFHEDARLIEPDSLPYGGVYTGKRNIMDMSHQIMNSYWRDFKLDVERVLCDTEYAIIYGRLSGTGVKSNKSWSVDFCEVWKAKDGFVEEIIPIYGDTKLVLDAL